MRGEIPTILESEFIKAEISSNGSYSVLDKQSQVSWHSNPYFARFGSVTFKAEGRLMHLHLDHFEVVSDDMNVRMRYSSSVDKTELLIYLKLLDDGRTLELSYEVRQGVNIEDIRLIDESFWTTDVENGYVVVPVREGLMITSNSGIAFAHRFGTFEYEGCHMEMLGVVKCNSAILLTWHDPHVTAEVRSTLGMTVGGAKQILSTSIDLTKTAKAVRVKFLGKGDHVAIARAYRETVERRGWLASWKSKIGKTPDVAKLFGAPNFKLWSCLERILDDGMKEKSVTVNWTFEEAAEIAEHLRNDLDIRRALFIIGGWIRRGYDNQHPDILPANPECGGDKALAETSRRVKDLGFLFCLHDNYQDIYGDSPSWSEDLVAKGADGSSVKGGFWAGGQAWIVCSKMGLELAKRPQNLPGVKDLFKVNAYFNDTTFAAGLYECHDPAHPLTKWDDMRYKQALSDYAMGLFGVFGSECGKEWAIAHSHFF